MSVGSVHATAGKDMTKSACEFLCVGKVKHLIRSMSVRERSSYTESNDLRIRVNSFKLFEERYRAALSVACGRFVEKFLTSLIDRLC